MAYMISPVHKGLWLFFFPPHKKVIMSFSVWRMFPVHSVSAQCCLFMFGTMILKILSHASRCILARHWQHSGTVSSLAEGNSRRASLEDLLYPLWKIKAFFTAKKETALSHTSEPDSPACSWPSRADCILSAPSEHFLSRLNILQILSKKKRETNIRLMQKCSIILVTHSKRRHEPRVVCLSLRCVLVPHSERTVQSV